MRRQLVLSLLAIALATPSIAAAQQTCQEHRTDNKVIGTVIGAGLGALFGNAVASHGGKPGGTIIGGVAGGVVGNQVAGSGSNNCAPSNAQGYYDADGRWHETANTATGYYDANGQWVAQGPSAAYATGADASYEASWSGVAADTRAREDWLESRIRQSHDAGRMADDGANRALGDLRRIRAQDQQYRQYGGGALTPRQHDYIQARLDDLRRTLPS